MIERPTRKTSEGTDFPVDATGYFGQFADLDMTPATPANSCVADQNTSATEPCQPGFKDQERFPEGTSA